MAMPKRTWWLRGYVAATAFDWDRRFSKWRVEIRLERGRIVWSWPRTPDAATEQWREAERRRRPDARY